MRHGGMVSFGGGDMFTSIVDNVIARAGHTRIGGYNNGHGLISGNQTMAMATVAGAGSGTRAA